MEEQATKRKLAKEPSPQSTVPEIDEGFSGNIPEQVAKPFDANEESKMPLGKTSFTSEEDWD